ncbi:DUF4351 domain-containing protein [Myxacorys almedinensis]|uniref:DUF4351 domain-containing protein n=1 Tax=Myxacorys almedinensis A TaxID=2690445 RepID=A0A8J8CLF5_9CYAN|nr:DUF4351 domain-containing protein [Myxacorys almedinensis]NDJ17705.1 DUF4351 domain-containing protein [Myxacorys almedinensis A]
MKQKPRRLLDRCYLRDPSWVSLQDRASVLSSEQLEALGEALLDLSSVRDLEAWFATNS